MGEGLWDQRLSAHSSIGKKLSENIYRDQHPQEHPNSRGPLSLTCWDLADQVFRAFAFDAWDLEIEEARVVWGAGFDGRGNFGVGIDSTILGFFVHVQL